MRKLTLVNVCILSVRLAFFFFLYYDYKGELDLKNLDLTQVFDLLKTRLKTEKALNPVIIIGSTYVFPGEKKDAI